MFTSWTLLLFIVIFAIFKGPHRVKSSEDSSMKNSKIFYAYPDQPVASPNITIAVVYDYNEEYGPSADYETIQDVMTMICEIENYNQGKGKFSPKGVFNALIMQTSSVKALHAYTMVEQVLGQNLYYAANGSSFGAVKNVPISAVLKKSTVKDFNVDAPLLSGVILPSINFVSNAFYYSFINHPLTVLSENADLGSLLISIPSPALISVYILELAKYFKWNLIGAVFSSDITGFYGQVAFESVLNALKDEYGIYIPCFSVLDSPRIDETFEGDLRDFASCISSTSKVQVILMWTNSDDAIFASEQLIKILGKDQGFIFIYPGIADGSRLTPDVQGSMFFTPYTNVSDSNSQFTCPQSAKDQIFNIFGTDVVDTATKFFGNCKITNPNLPVCQNILGDSFNECTCSSDQIVRIHIYFWQ